MATIYGVRSGGDAVADTDARERAERETTPAPPSGSPPLGELESLPSARPTSVPDFDMAALAFESSLLPGRLPSLPLDLAVPERTRQAPPDDLDLRESFLLLHVDGRSSVREIASLTAITVDEVLASFLALAATGLVELRGSPAPRGAPRSGERRAVQHESEDAETPSRRAETERIRTGS